MTPIYVAYVSGNHDEYDEFVCDSPETARAMAEKSYDDYFGQPVEWKEPVTHSGDKFFQIGTFYSYAHNKETVIVSEGRLLTMEDAR